MAGSPAFVKPSSRWDTPQAQPQNPTATFGNPNTFTSAANQQAQDYDKIMKNYESIFNQGRTNPLSYTNIAPTISNYQESARQDKALSDLSELSSTGGYSDEGIAALRERGISPIRSVYSSAQRNIDRAKGLSGGYSPNYAAVTAKMARDQASEIGNAMNNVNAGIAQNVAANRISAAPAFASAANTESGMRNASLTHNADVYNDINKFNASNALDAQKTNRGNQLGAVQGMTNLYGTTPALTNLFGNQIMQSTQAGQNQQQINNQKEAQINNSVFATRRNG
jgi:hypothetical protein